MNYGIKNKTTEEMPVELKEAIKKRRSIRKYKPDPIPDETLQILMEASNGSSCFCW
jgi:hypothetical protein